MRNPSLDDADRDSGWRSDPASSAHFDVALVVGTSPVNRVVAMRIAERAGLKVHAASPSDAHKLLEAKWPGIVILDGGADGRECDCLLEDLAAQKRIGGGRAPQVILLQNALPSDGQPGRGGTIDAVVAKPITPDRLQPLIRSLIDRLGS